MGAKTFPFFLAFSVCLCKLCQGCLAIYLSRLETAPFVLTLYFVFAIVLLPLLPQTAINILPSCKCSSPIATYLNGSISSLNPNISFLFSIFRLPVDHLTLSQLCHGCRKLILCSCGVRVASSNVSAAEYLLNETCPHCRRIPTLAHPSLPPPRPSSPPFQIPRLLSPPR